MRIHIIQHVDFEGPGYIEQWALRNGYPISTTKLFEQANLPDLKTIDRLIIMGGPMGVYEDDKYKWLSAEKAFIKAAIHADKEILGICLGAQLIADALGAKVVKNSVKEIGWYPVTTTIETQHHSVFNHFGEEQIVLHWHGDTFDLPMNTTHLMQSTGCRNQAFIYGDRVIGLQFHLETTPDSLKKLISNARHDITKGPYIMSEEEMLAHASFCRNTNVLMHHLLEKMSIAF